MIRKGQKSQKHSTWRLLLGILCLALVVFGSTVQVAHSHPDGTISHADCSLCATAHVVAQTAEHPVSLSVALVVASIPSVVPSPRPATFVAFALFTRPPPVVSIPA